MADLVLCARKRAREGERERVCVCLCMCVCVCDAGGETGGAETKGDQTSTWRTNRRSYTVDEMRGLSMRCRAERGKGVKESQNSLQRVASAARYFCD